MSLLKMRATPVAAQVAGVNVNGNTLVGVAVAQAVEALGHDLLLDNVSLEQIVALGNQAKNGIKSRFTHPGLSSDGLGKFLGRLKNFRMDYSADTTTARADLHISDISRRSPDGDLGSYILDLAHDDPSAFGMSVVIGVEPVWVLNDGSEKPVDGRGEKPDNSIYELPVARVVELYASDVVDEPAANRDGIFSAFSRTTNLLSAEIFAEIDNALTMYGISRARAYELAMKYFNARGVAGKAYAHPHTISHDGLRRLQSKFTEDVMGKEETEALEFEQIPEDELDEILVLDNASLDIYQHILEQVVAQVSEKIGNDDEFIDLLSGRVDRLERLLTEMQSQLTVLGMAVAQLRGEPNLTVKMSGDQATARTPRQRLSASTVPAGLRVPPKMQDFSTLNEEEDFGDDPVLNQLRLADMRHRGGK